MSEDKIRKLHEKLSEKLIEEAQILRFKSDVSRLVNISQEIVDIRREINKELEKLRGNKKQNIETTES